MLARMLARHLAALAWIPLAGCFSRGISPVISEATLPADDYLIEIPVTADRYLIAEVKLGAEPRSALIDTGASMSVIDDDLAAALGLATVGTAPVIDFEGKRASAPVVRVPSLTLGGVPLRDVGMVVLDLDTLGDAECKNIGAVIGNNVMRGAIEVDVGGGVVRLAASPERLGARPGGLTSSSYPPSYNVLLPPVVTTFLPQPVWVDTGSPMTITATRSVVRRLDVGASLALTTVAGGVHGRTARPVKRRLFAWSGPPIGGLDLTGVSTVGGAGSTTIGLGVLRSFVMRVDREARTITLWPNDTPLRKGIDSFGLAIDPTDEPRVYWLIEGSPASEAGVRWGDRVVSIDGEALAAMAKPARCLAIRDLNKREAVRLGIARGSGVQEVALKRRQLLP